MSVKGEKISKSFAGVRVLSDVDIDLADGEIHALLGANGSGKSTLAKILTGVYQPDAGTIEVGGLRLGAIASPNQANKLGIAIVHQEAPLIDTSTVAECIALFRGYPSVAGKVQWRKLRAQVAEMMETFGIAVDPDQLAGTLSPAERALVALVIALDRVKAGLNLLILDEVTASLPSDDAEPYLDRVGAIARQGMSVLMVTHRLDEIRGRAARITILRDGRTVYAGPTDAIDDRAIVGKMVGDEEDRAIARRRPAVAAEPRVHAVDAKSDVLMTVERVRVDRLREVSFDLHRGEILGVAGLAETGIAELPEILSGARPFAGRIRVNGRVLSPWGGPRAAIGAGVAVLPADRLRSGGIGTLSVGENLLLPAIGKYFLKPALERTDIEHLIAKFDVRPPIASTLFQRLSGGNQQKALLGKWLNMKPSVLVLDDPTSGVDPGARERIFELLRQAAADGLGILFFSTEPEQLAAMCSRIIVLKNGVVATELTGVSLDHQTISQWCYG